MHNSTAAMKNIPMTLIVSITKLITLFSIFVLIFAVKQPCFSNPVQNYYIKLPKHGSEEEKCKKSSFFFWIWYKKDTTFVDCASNLCDASHFFNCLATCATIRHACVPNLIPLQFGHQFGGLFQFVNILLTFFQYCYAM